MNKKKSLFITLIITGVLLLTAACGKSSEAEKESAKELSEISINDLNDTFTLYQTEELHILGKYMFITIDEYDDIDSGYTDVDYFVYTADQPMDNHDLFEEYYVAMFYDNAGEAHLASLSNRNWEFSEQIESATPLTS